MTATPKRKGARSTKDIPPDILVRLNRGELETANLVEWLAVDQRLLLENVLSEAGKTNYLSPILARIELLPKQTVNTINEAVGTGLLEQAIAIARYTYRRLGAVLGNLHDWQKPRARYCDDLATHTAICSRYTFWCA